MSALMRLAGEVRSVERKVTAKGDPYRRITVLTEIPDHLGDGVEVMLWSDAAGVDAEPRATVDWFVNVTADRFGLKCGFLAVASEPVVASAF